LVGAEAGIFSNIHRWKFYAWKQPDIMDNPKKAIYINFIVVLLCILLAVVIYINTGQLAIAIFIAPPIIYWILERKNRKDSDL